MEKDNTLISAVSNELMKTSIDLGVDYSEIGIDEFLTNGILKEIPIVKTLLSITKIGISIKERRFIKKLLIFLKEFNSGTIKPEKLASFKENLNSDQKFKEQVTEQLMVYLDAHLTLDKSKTLAKLFKAFVDGQYDWDYFNTLGICLDSLHPKSFDYLRKLSQYEFKIPLSPELEDRGLEYDSENEALLSASGLAYDASTWESSFEVTRLGQDLFNFGIK